MSDKDLLKKMLVKDTRTSDNENVTPQEARPQIFYRCRCPECGKDALRVESGVTLQLSLLGITSYGEIGCSTTDLEPYYPVGIYCAVCRHQICCDFLPKDTCNDEFLSEWAESNGEARITLPFICPKCGSRELHRVEVGIEFSNCVVAVCDSDAQGNEPLIAVSEFRDIGGGGSYRYRCSRSHELGKDDGSPVKTEQELVEWLKARQAVNKG